MTPENIKRAYEARRHAVEELRSLADAAAGREFTAEEKQTEERLHADIDKFDAVVTDGIDFLQRSAEVERAVTSMEQRSGLVVPGTPDFIATEQRALRAFLAGETKAVEFHAPSVEQRAAMAKGAGATGGFLVPTTMYDQIVAQLRDLSSVMQANATVVNTASGEDITVPRSNAFPSAAIVSEGGSYSASDATVQQTTLRAFKYGFISQASTELLADSAFNAEGYIARVGGEALSNGINTDFVVGAGSTTAPEGVCTAAATTGFTLATAGTVTTDSIIDWYHSVDRPYRANASWIVDDSLVKAVRKLKDSSNQYLWQPGLQAGQPDVLLGRPVLTDTAVPDFAATAGRVLGAFGDFQRGYIVRIAGGVRVDRSTEYAFATDLVSWKFSVRADGRIVDTNAIKTLKNP